MKNNLQVVDTKYGDVDGDGMIDTVYLAGNKAFGQSSPFVTDITLFIESGKTKELTYIPLKENTGANPTLFLGDFTGNQVDDVLIVISTGGSGGTINGYVYSFIDGDYRKIFDTDLFNQTYTYYVNYQDYYKLDVISKNLHKKYTLDITFRGSNYLTPLYYENGHLKQPIHGDVYPLSGLYPIDFERNGIYELYTFQAIAGLYHADGFGNIENVLKWNSHQFIPSRQYVSIYGEEFPHASRFF